MFFFEAYCFGEFLGSERTYMLFWFFHIIIDKDSETFIPSKKMTDLNGIFRAFCLWLFISKHRVNLLHIRKNRFVFLLNLLKSIICFLLSGENSFFSFIQIPLMLIFSMNSNGFHLNFLWNGCVPSFLELYFFFFRFSLNLFQPFFLPPDQNKLIGGQALTMQINV